MEHPHRRIIKPARRRCRCGYTNTRRDKIECMIRLDFPTTNNETEYEALVAGLDLAKAAGAENMIIHYDS